MLLQHPPIKWQNSKLLRFNTASSRYYYLSPSFYLHFVQVREVRTSSSLCSSAVSHPSAHTVNSKCCCLSPLFYLLFVQVLEMCGPHCRFAPLLSRTLRRIPQMLGTVATISENPQMRTLKGSCFNTVNGRYCCNAIVEIAKKTESVITVFQYRKR